MAVPGRDKAPAVPGRADPGREDARAAQLAAVLGRDAAVPGCSGAS